MDLRIEIQIHQTETKRFAMSRGKLHISYSPYHSFYHWETKLNTTESISKRKCVTLLDSAPLSSIVCHLLSVLSSSLLFTWHFLWIHCSVQLWVDWPHVFKHQRKEKRAFDDRIDSLFLTKTFVYFCPMHTQLLLLLLSQLFCQRPTI